MMFNCKINKDTCFYYWIQVMSRWDPHLAETDANMYYRNNFRLTTTQEDILYEIKSIISNHPKPFLLLAELYSGSLVSGDSVKIRDLSEVFRGDFDSIWHIGESKLVDWTKKLTDIRLESFYVDFVKISHFLGAKLPSSPMTAYILLNPKDMQPTGHAISGTNFILLRPSGQTGNPALRATIATLVHEYIHMIEYNSKITRELFKSSYDEIVRTSGAECPAGYLWPALYAETIVRIFANRVTGGYLREKVYDKPRPTVTDMKTGFDKMYNTGSITTEQILSWIALNVLDDTIAYMKLNKQLDRKIVDDISRLFVKYYS